MHVSEEDVNVKTQPYSALDYMLALVILSNYHKTNYTRVYECVCNYFLFQ